MRVHQEDRVVVLIDGANLIAATQMIGRHLNFKELHNGFSKICRLVSMRYYTAIPDRSEVNHTHRLVTWLQFNGYVVITKPTKSFIQDDGTIKTKGNMDVEIAVDGTALAYTQNIDQVFLFSGDGDFTALVKKLQDMGIRVSIVSIESMVADELRKQANEFVPLQELPESILQPAQELSATDAVYSDE